MWVFLGPANILEHHTFGTKTLEHCNQTVFVLLDKTTSKYTSNKTLEMGRVYKGAENKRVSSQTSYWLSCYVKSFIGKDII